MSEVTTIENQTIVEPNDLVQVEVEPNDLVQAEAEPNDLVQVEVDQGESPEVQGLGSFLGEKCHKYLDKLRKSFELVTKFYTVFNTLCRYGFWIKYVLAFVVFILIPLGVFGLFKVIWFLIKSSAYFCKKTFEYLNSKSVKTVQGENIIPLVGNLENQRLQILNVVSLIVKIFKIPLQF